MPLAISIVKAQQEEVEDFTIGDDTGSYDAINNSDGYGSPNDARTDRANYLLVSKNDPSGNRTYLTVSNTDPLNTLVWNLQSTIDGLHQATLLSFRKWSGATAYVANTNAIFYTVTGLFYKCIQNNTNIAPDSGGGDAYWTEIEDFTEIMQGYSNVDVVDYEFLIDARTSICIADEFFEVIEEDFLCKLSLDDASHPLNLIASLEGAHSKMAVDEGADAEQIILAITECCE
jgi:hypothetical protein